MPDSRQFLQHIMIHSKMLRFIPAIMLNLPAMILYAPAMLVSAGAKYLDCELRLWVGD
jgi:hypothetical protein